MINQNELQPLDANLVLNLWSRTYNARGKPDWSHIFPYYRDDIIFQDAIQRIEGKEEFTDMCNRLTERCDRLEMQIEAIAENSPYIFMEWIMTMVFRKTPNTPIHGCTRLTLDERGMIKEQRDYYDLWGDIFQNVPLMKNAYPKFMRRVFG